ncbi:MAG: glycoside hydrolase family 31 protein [Acetatifactor sp.]|nr:glycoside hydrolase family 31 protein [Acetatifactor sp.]
MIIENLKDEYWYGGCVKNGTQMPLTSDSNIIIDTTINMTPNQAMPLFISSKGRYLWKEKGFRAVFADGRIEVDDDCYVSPSYGNLKQGYLQAMREHFPFGKGAPGMELFRHPIYNTWIELTFYQNQADILRYSEGILAHGMPAGVLMIDDGWSEYYGDWTFHSGRFPDPKAMIEKLHADGFKVMLWICPFIGADSLKYREALAKGILIMDEQDKPYILHWWNGYSAVLDMSNPEAREWLKEQLSDLQKLGVDGFKFDAGDSFFYKESNKTYGNTTPNEQSILWETFGEQYAYNEFRVTFLAGGAPVLQRLCDKKHSWDSEGVGGLIPDSLLQGITGHPFSCPDMIGGGEYVNFHEALAERFDEELFVRHCEIASLMPAMQFSAAPYRLLSGDNYAKVQKCIELRESYIDKILALVENAEKTGEPILRYMTYEFPDEPVEKLIDQFMLGDKYLVAPITTKGETGRKVYLPRGEWRHNKDILTGLGCEQWFEQGDEPLLIFEKLS